MDSKSISERLRKESYRPGLKRPPYGFLDTIAPAIAEAMSNGMSTRAICVWLQESEGLKVSPAGVLKAAKRHQAS
jgi:hypothetical protein